MTVRLRVRPAPDEALKALADGPAEGEPGGRPSGDDSTARRSPEAVRARRGPADVVVGAGGDGTVPYGRPSCANM